MGAPTEDKKHNLHPVFTAQTRPPSNVLRNPKDSVTMREAAGAADHGSKKSPIVTCREGVSRDKIPDLGNRKLRKSEIEEIGNRKVRRPNGASATSDVDYKASTFNAQHSTLNVQFPQPRTCQRILKISSISSAGRAKIGEISLARSYRFVISGCVPHLSALNPDTRIVIDVSGQDGGRSIYLERRIQ